MNLHIILYQTLLHTSKRIYTKQYKDLILPLLSQSWPWDFKGPFHRIGSAWKWYGWIGLHRYKNRGWYTELLSWPAFFYFSIFLPAVHCKTRSALRANLRKRVFNHFKFQPFLNNVTTVLSFIHITVLYSSVLLLVTTSEELLTYI
jgi:hypothetical protein